MDQFSSHPLYKKHTIDTVMSSLWEFYSKNFLVLFLSSFVMSLAVQYLSSSINFSGIDITNPESVIAKMKEFLKPILIITLISFIFTVILHYYIIYHPVDDSINIFTSVYKSLKYLIPYLIIIILFTFFGSFAIVLGFFVLIIGMFFAALYIAVLYLFVLPILMVEGNHIGHAISRSFSLTHRRFWSNLGWVAVVGLILIVFSFIFSSLILIPFSGNFLKVLTNPQEVTEVLNFTSNPVYIILSAIVNAVTFPVMPVLAAILYFNGKAREEQPEVVTASESEPPRVTVDDLYAKPLPEEKKENQDNQV